MSEDMVEESRKDESQLAKTASPSPSPLLINGKKLLESFILYYLCHGCSTSDYVTLDHQNLLDSLDCNKDKFSCPKSLDRLDTTKSKSFRQDQVTLNPQSSIFSGSQQIEDLVQDGLEAQEAKVKKPVSNGTQQTHRVKPPPCIRNPYLSDALDPFGNQRFKCADIYVHFSFNECDNKQAYSPVTGGAGPTRFHTDFVEIEQIGAGHFGSVYKVLNRIDGCLYAVKQVTRPMCQNSERRKALMEVQSLAALGSHENIVGYYSSWFENEHLYIQMELCHSNLSSQKSSRFTECDALTFLHQLAKVLLFMHDRGIAHLDVKPDNIFFKNGVYKLGDFGCATLLNNSLPIQEGDTRYMPHEILNENFDHLDLDKVDIFALGASVYELVTGLTLTKLGPQFLSLREGNLPLPPGHSPPFQNLLKVMMDADPTARPSAKELLANPIFDMIQTNQETGVKTVIQFQL